MTRKRRMILTSSMESCSRTNLIETEPPRLFLPMPMVGAIAMASIETNHSNLWEKPYPSTGMPGLEPHSRRLEPQYFGVFIGRHGISTEQLCSVGSVQIFLF
jgi:hypothetical protein